ncbi:MAG: PhoH family protein [Spirochaetia bacterium]|nr:PhoH family protein [Spirochaetia bacterium]
MPQQDEGFVLIDTNVFLLDPTALYKFGKSTLIIPLVVIEELDGFKREPGSIGKAARETIRRLDQLRAKGSLVTGVALETGGLVRIILLKESQGRLPTGLDSNVKDNQILQCALQLREDGDTPVRIISRDADLRIKADVLGLECQDYMQYPEFEEEPSRPGFREVDAGDGAVNAFYSNKSLTLDGGLPPGEEHTINEFLFLRGETKSALARPDSEGKTALPLRYQEEKVFDIVPRNREQRYAFEALLDPEVQLVTLSGKAGTGKTLLAIACGLHQVTDNPIYRRILVARPIMPMGRDIGFLPGELSEKIQPWMQPVYDNLEFILGDGGSQQDKNMGIDYLKQAGMLSVEPLTYIRGRSIPRQFIVIDEAQNLTPHEAKTIITRAGEGSKMVFTGDLYQIDHPYLNRYSNGLAFTAERFRGQKIASHITLMKGERSGLAELASRLME